jgi:hypothetical protein
LELTQTHSKPKTESEPRTISNPLSDRPTKDSGFEMTIEESSFVSASHEYAVKQFEAASGNDDRAEIIKAERVAHSMGFSHRYDKNPFDVETQKELARAYEQGQKQQERQIEESRIVKEDPEKDYEG